MQEDQQNHSQKAQKSLKIFAGVTLFIQIIVMTLFCFVEFEISKINDIWSDMSIFTLIGFSFFIAHIKGYSYSALLYVFFINALVFQLNILFLGLQNCLNADNCSQTIPFLKINEQILVRAHYGVFSILIGFGGIFGKIGPLQILIFSIFGSIGYTLNFGLIKYTSGIINDSPYTYTGSGQVFLYGSLYGLVVSCVLHHKEGSKKFQTTYISLIMSIIGAMFLWIFWPSFNSAAITKKRQQSFLQTVFSLSGSAMGAFAMASCYQDKYNVSTILFGSLSGGVILSSMTIMATIQNIGQSLGIGFLTGLISTLIYIKMNDDNENGCCGKYGDEFGLISIFLIPSLVSFALEGPITYLYFKSVHKQLKEIQKIYYPFIFLGLSLGSGFLFGVVSTVLIYPCQKLIQEYFYDETLYLKIPKGNEEEESQNNN